MIEIASCRRVRPGNQIIRVSADWHRYDRNVRARCAGRSGWKKNVSRARRYVPLSRWPMYIGFLDSIDICRSGTVVCDQACYGDDCPVCRDNLSRLEGKHVEGIRAHNPGMSLLHKASWHIRARLLRLAVGSYHVTWLLIYTQLPHHSGRGMRSRICRYMMRSWRVRSMSVSRTADRERSSRFNVHTASTPETRVCLEI